MYEIPSSTPQSPSPVSGGSPRCSPSPPSPRTRSCASSSPPACSAVAGLAGQRGTNRRRRRPRTVGPYSTLHTCVHVPFIGFTHTNRFSPRPPHPTTIETTSAAPSPKNASDVTSRPIRCKRRVRKHARRSSEGWKLEPCTRLAVESHRRLRYNPEGLIPCPVLPSAAVPEAPCCTPDTPPIRAKIFPVRLVVEHVRFRHTQLPACRPHARRIRRSDRT